MSCVLRIFLTSAFAFGLVFGASADPCEDLRNNEEAVRETALLTETLHSALQKESVDVAAVKALIEPHQKFLGRLAGRLRASGDPDLIVAGDDLKKALNVLKASASARDLSLTLSLIETGFLSFQGACAAR